jgi:hypothetical protein
MYGGQEQRRLVSAVPTLKHQKQEIRPPRSVPELCSAPWLEPIVEHLVSEHEGDENHHEQPCQRADSNGRYADTFYSAARRRREYLDLQIVAVHGKIEKERDASKHRNRQAETPNSYIVNPSRSAPTTLLHAFTWHSAASLHITALPRGRAGSQTCPRRREYANNEQGLFVHANVMPLAICVKMSFHLTHPDTRGVLLFVKILGLSWLFSHHLLFD